MEGPETFGRFIVIELPTFEQAVACFESKNIRKRRNLSAAAPASSENVIVDGGNATPRFQRVPWRFSRSIIS